MLSGQSGAVLLASVVAVTWGISPLFEKAGLSEGGKPVQASVVFVSIASFLYWVAAFVIGGPFEGLTKFAVAVFGIAGVFGTALGRVSVFEGVKRVGPSVNGAGISTRPVFSALLAWAWLGEPVSPRQAVGIAVLVGGLTVISLSKGGEVSGWSTRDLAFPVGAAALFGAGFVLRRFGLNETGVTPLQAVAVNETAALVALVLFVSYRGDAGKSPPLKSYAYFVAGGVVTAVGLLSFFAALAVPEGNVALVDPIAASAPLFTVTVSWALPFGSERVTRRLAVGMALTVVGAALVAV